VTVIKIVHITISYFKFHINLYANISYLIDVNTPPRPETPDTNASENSWKIHSAAIAKGGNYSGPS